MIVRKNMAGGLIHCSFNPVRKAVIKQFLLGFSRCNLNFLDLNDVGPR